ncbi:solute carrier organic anion transporter family member 2A1-like [Glandiceps talaboti]
MDSTRKGEGESDAKEKCENEAHSTKKQYENDNSRWVINDIRIFVALIFSLRLVYFICSSTSISVLTTVEKRYSLTATQQGYIISAGNLATLCTIPFISFFIGKPSNHRPRWISFGFILFAASNIFLILPYILSQPYEFDKVGNFSSAAGSQSRGLCNSNISTPDCSNDEIAQSEDNAIAYRLLVTGKVFGGIAQSFIFPASFSYIDDFSGKSTAIYLGLIDSAVGLGIPLGFGVISPATLTLYVDFNRVDMSDINIDDSDPRWVGAWWLPIAICIPILVILACPLVFFPKYLTNRDTDNAEKGEEKLKSERRREQGNHIFTIRGLLRSVLAMLKNPCFLLTVLAYTINTPVGFVLFMPKYFQKDLGFTASMGNMIMGFLWLFPNFPTGVLIGIMIKKLKLGMLRLAKLVLMIIAVIIITNALVIALPCEGPYFEGTKSGQTMDLQCTDCDCSLEHYQPVCGSDGLNYYSPCYAGCETAVSDKNFTDCHCINTENGDSSFADGGLCAFPTCKYFTAFLIILGFFAIGNSSMSLPTTIITMRSVDPHLKSFAMGMRSVIFELFTLVTPLITGLLIDSTCILWREECGVQGACAQYDNFMYRVLFMGVSVGFSGVAFCIMVLLLFILKRRENTSNNIDDDSSSLKGKEDGGNGVQLKAIKNCDQGNPAYVPE